MIYTLPESMLKMRQHVIFLFWELTLGHKQSCQRSRKKQIFTSSDWNEALHRFQNGDEKTSEYVIDYCFSILNGLWRKCAKTYRFAQRLLNKQWSKHMIWETE